MSQPATSTRCSISPSREDVELTIVGPEAPLVAGIVDRFAADGLRCFGPDTRRRAARRLEGVYARNSCSVTAYPRPGTPTFTAADFDPAFVRAQRLPLVVKADGLAAGKGVVICETHDAAIEAAQRHARRAASARPATRS